MNSKNIRDRSLMEEVADAAQEVYKILGSGHEEEKYRNALVIEMRLRGLSYETEKPFEVKYKGYSAGIIIADLFVWRQDEKLLVEVKVMESIEGSVLSQGLLRELRQTGHYFRLGGLPDDLHMFMVNFPYPSAAGPEFIDLKKQEML